MRSRRMHPGFLDVLHDGADECLRAVRDRVDVDLYRAFDEPVDEDGALDRPEVAAE